MDPLVRAYMFEHWAADQEEAQELERMNAILVGSFTNPEAARNMIKAENPDHASSDEDFEKSLEMVRKDREPRRRRKRIKDNGG